MLLCRSQAIVDTQFSLARGKVVAAQVAMKSAKQEFAAAIRAQRSARNRIRELTSRIETFSAQKAARLRVVRDAEKNQAARWLAVLSNSRDKEMAVQATVHVLQAAATRCRVQAQQEGVVVVKSKTTARLAEERRKQLGLRTR